MIQYAPSIMCANLLNLEKDIRILDRAGVDLYHIDVMDGHFVPNLCLNFNIVKQLKTITQTPMDVHLMVENPDSFISILKDVQADHVTFHIEAVRYPIRLIREIKSNGMKAGLAINPSTSIESLSLLLKELDYVLIMTVEPGFAGQEFIPQMLDKITRVNQMKKYYNPNLSIEVDGNISVEKAKWCIERGADILVLGTSGIFIKDKDLYTACVDLKKAIEKQTTL